MPGGRWLWLLLAAADGVAIGALIVREQIAWWLATIAFLALGALIAVVMLADGSAVALDEDSSDVSTPSHPTPSDPAVIERVCQELKRIDRMWSKAYRPVRDLRVYVMRCRLAELSHAAQASAQDLRRIDTAGLGCSFPETEDWRPPFELSPKRYRPGPTEPWQRLDRAGQALAAVRAADDRTLEALAVAYEELADATRGVNRSLVDELSDDNAACSFCEKPRSEVKKIIAGSGLYICDECVELCNKVLDEELGRNDD